MDNRNFENLYFTRMNTSGSKTFAVCFYLVD